MGRPLLYGTTPGFLEQFALRHLGELPRADELAIALRDPNAPAVILGDGFTGSAENVVSSDSITSTDTPAADIVPADRGTPEVASSATPADTSSESTPADSDSPYASAQG